MKTLERLLLAITTITLERLLLIGALIVIILLSLFLSHSVSQHQKDEDTISSLLLSNQKLETLTNKLGETIYTQEIIVTNNQNAIKDMTDTIFLLKKRDKRNTTIIAYYQGRTVVGIHDPLVIPLDTLSMRRFADSVEKKCSAVITFYRDSSIQVPHTDSLITPYFHFDFTLSKTDRQPSLTVNTLTFPDTLNLRFVEHKGGIFKKSKVEVQFFHSNPHVRSIGSSSVMYVPQKKPRILEKALLIGAGIFIGTKL